MQCGPRWTNQIKELKTFCNGNFYTKIKMHLIWEWIQMDIIFFSLLETHSLLFKRDLKKLTIWGRHCYTTGWQCIKDVRRTGCWVHWRTNKIPFDFGLHCAWLINTDFFLNGIYNLMRKRIVVYVNTSFGCCNSALNGNLWLWLSYLCLFMEFTRIEACLGLGVTT